MMRRTMNLRFQVGVLQQEWVDEDPRDESMGIQREWRSVPDGEMQICFGNEVSSVLPEGNSHKNLVEFVKSIAELPPSAFERGDDPSYLIDEAKDLLKSMETTPAVTSNERKG